MKLSDLTHLMALDRVLATSGLLIPDFARERKLTQTSVSEMLGIMSIIGRSVEPRHVNGVIHLFYPKTVDPVFWETPTPERRGAPARIDRDEVRRLRAEGFSRIETATLVGCTPDMVRKIEVGEVSAAKGRKA